MLGGGACELLAQRVVGSGQSSCSEYPSSLTLGESLLFFASVSPLVRRALSWVLGYGSGPPATQRSLFLFKSHVSSSNDLFDTAPLLQDGWTCQLAQTRNHSSGSHCSSHLSRLSGRGTAETSVDPRPPGKSAFPRWGHCLRPVYRRCGRRFSAPR